MFKKVQHICAFIICLVPVVFSTLQLISDSSAIHIGLLVSSVLTFLIFCRVSLKSFNQEKSYAEVTRIKDKIDILSGVTDQISNTSNNLSQGSTEQAEALEETAAAAEEICQTANRNKSLTQESKELIDVCLKDVGAGEVSMNGLNSAFETITGGNVEFEDFIKKSNERFAEIKEVISMISDKTSVINDIVFQTKLLAFNASVEAARAGEHGKGFAVVAQEVGSLAAMSGKASNEISSILEEGLDKVDGIIDDTSSAVDTILLHSSQNIKNGEKYVSEGIRNYHHIKTQVENVHHKINEIALASNEQTIGIEEVNRAINLLEQNNHRTSLVAKQSLQISNSLQEEFNSLEIIFKSLSLVSSHEEEIAHFQWDEKFEIGVSQMDDEHKILISKINVFVNALKANENVIQKFNDLKAYTLKHFEDEENYMKSFNYESFPAHQKIHQTMIEKILEYEKELHAGTLDKKRLIAFLKNWLVSHILGVDTQYAKASRSSVLKAS